MKYKTHPLLWFLLLVIAIAIIAFVFIRAFEQGIKVASVTTKVAKKTSEKVGPDIRKLRIATPAAITQGKQLFMTNCASCHGPEGKGDGPKSAELNPKPRNYQTEKFKNGSSPLKLEKTLRNGLGTMPAFPLMSIEDRFAIVHYVRSLIPNPEEDDSTEIAALPVVGEKTLAEETLVQRDTTKPRIPIKLAMMILSEEQKAKKTIPLINLPTWMTQKNPNQRVQ